MSKKRKNLICCQTSAVIESPNHETAWKGKVFIHNRKVSMKLDSGADVTVLSENFYKSEFHIWPIVPTNKVLIGPCKTKIPCVGKMNATNKTKIGIVTEEVFIVPSLEKPLLSRKAGVALKLIQKVNEINEVKKNDEIDEVTEKITQNFCTAHSMHVPLPLLKKTKEEIENVSDGSDFQS